MKKILVVYYSLSGHVEKVAQEVAKDLDADIEKIIPEKEYPGKEGYNRAGNEALMGKRPIIKFSKDPSNYELVIVGTPMWVFNMSSPVRSYIAMNRSKIKKAAFFSSSGSPFMFALWFMEHAYGKKAVSIMQVRENEIDENLHKEKEKKFVNEIKKSIN